MMMMGALTHGLVVIQRHPVEQYTALLHVQILNVPPNYKGIIQQRKKRYVISKNSL